LRQGLTVARSTILTFFESPIILAFPADVIRGSSRIPISGAGTRDDPQNNVCGGGYHNTLFPPHPILNKLFLFKRSWEYAVLPGAFENNTFIQNLGDKQSALREIRKTENGQAVLSLLCYACLLISLVPIMPIDHSVRRCTKPLLSAKWFFYVHADETHYLHLASY